MDSERKVPCGHSQRLGAYSISEQLLAKCGFSLSRNRLEMHSNYAHIELSISICAYGLEHHISAFVGIYSIIHSFMNQNPKILLDQGHLLLHHPPPPDPKDASQLE